MAKLTPNQLQTQLASNYQLLKQGQPRMAVEKLRKLLKKAPNSPDVSHLMALAYKALNDGSAAKRYFIKSLKINAQQPEVHNNLANLYKSEAEFSKAERHYRLALSMNQSYSDAKRNLALCLASQAKYPEALNLLKEVLSVKPNDLAALTGSGDCYREMAFFEEAKSCYQQALVLNPEHVNALHNLGLTHHLNGDLDEAKNYYAKAYEYAENDVRVIQSYTSILAETGSTDQAVDLLERAVEKFPAHIGLHTRLNELLWENQRTKDFGASFDRAILVEPNNEELHAGFVSQLFRAGQLDKVNLVLEQSLPRFKSSARLLALKGQVDADAKDFESSKQAFEKSLAIGFSKDAAQPLVKLAILLDDYVLAQATIDALMEHDNNCQMNWALQSLVWRLQGDDRYSWLCDYESQIKTFTLTTPQGYESLEQYLRQLEKSLLAKHISEIEPLEQTLRNGTQTAPRLFHSQDSEIQVLRDQLQGIVKMYIDELPDDSSHPMYRRKSEHFKFSGSWSVKLKPNGFHVNHVHPEGWISSSFYIQIPSSVSAEGGGFEGCIKFGESPLGLGGREIVERAIRPEAGMVVLFPSFIWHGTVPFSGSEEDYRLTAPFDVFPVSTESEMS